MKITCILFFLFLSLTPAFSQDLANLAREMVFGKDTACSRNCYRYLMSIIGDQRLGTDHIQQYNGVAISPEAAAACMLEHTRTQVFVRGLYQAAMSLGKEDVNILYVGCGPLAPFMTLTAPLLPKARYGLVEISENAAATANVLIQRLGLHYQLDTMIVADATEMQLPHAEQYDIIITETMDAGLNDEMMIPILIHILPQLKKEVLLIPEEVVLELIFSKKAYNEVQLEQHPIFTATGLVQCYWEEGRFPETDVMPPETKGAKIFVGTRVRVFGDIYLNHNESVITRKLPVRYIPGKPVQFAYSISPPRLIINNGGHK